MVDLAGSECLTDLRNNTQIDHSSKMYYGLSTLQEVISGLASEKPFQELPLS